MPYTYLIGWSKLQKFYYGVRYSKNCDPSDLWVSYFSSSKFVARYRKKFGEPDIISIRKTFQDGKSARIWESKVLNRLDVANHSKFLNETNGSWGLSHYEITEQHRRKLSLALKGKKKTSEHIAKLIESRKGWTPSIEQRERQSKRLKGTSRPKSFSDKISSMIWINNGDETKRINQSDIIPEGWILGRIRSWNNPKSPTYSIRNNLTNETFIMIRSEFCKAYGYKSANLPIVKSIPVKYKHWILSPVLT